MTIKQVKNLPNSLIKKYQSWEWSFERLDACPYLLSVLGGIVRDLRKYFPEMKIMMPFIQGKLTIWHYRERELEAVYQKVVDSTKKDLAFVTRLKKKWQKDIKYFYEVYRRYKKLNLQRLTNEKLLSSYKKFFNLFRCSVIIPFFIEGITVGRRKIIDENLLAWLKKNEQEKSFNLIYQSLTTPEKPTFLAKAQIDLINILQSLDIEMQKTIKNQKAAIAGGLLEKNKKVIARINKYLNKYSWLRNNYYETHLLSLNDFIEEAKYFLNKKAGLSKQAKGLFNRERIKKDKERVLKKFSFPKELRRQLQLLAFLTHWQDERKKSIFVGSEIMDEFLEELGRRSKIKRLYLRSIVPDEYETVLKGKLGLDSLKQRQKNSLVIFEPAKITILAGINARKANEQIFKQEVNKGIKEIKGISASSGKIQGQVKILLSAKEDYKMKPGDILVAGMTRPDYINSMRQASAIITDEGGITCHAAIISRELKIPCIVGTKIATQVLSDGDLVAVDAEKGVVKILNNLN